MTGPQRYLTRMAIFLAVVIAVAAVLSGPLVNAFMANPALNGLILAVLLGGIAYIVRSMLLLRPEVKWIDTFRRSDPGLSVQAPPQLLAPMATMLGKRSGRRMTLSATATRTLLDGIASRLDETRDISRYMIGLLIFLGLLGTFWGLSLTVGAVGAAINTLTGNSGDFQAQFDSLRHGLAGPLEGMGTAFSSSLFGLAGSLVLGFLDLQAGQAMNRFYNDLEEWLSSVTRLGSGGSMGEGEQSVPAYVQALLEQTADSLDGLQRTLTRTEDSRGSSQTALVSLTEKLATLSDQMRAEQGLLVKLIEGQMEMRPVLQKRAEGHSGLDAASATHLRNLDVSMSHLLDITAKGQDTMVKELRSALKLIARTLAAIGDRRQG